MTSSDFTNRPSDSIDTLADVKFSGHPECRTLPHELPLEEWLEDARKDYALLRLSSALTSQDDVDLTTQVRAIDNPEVWLEFLQGLDAWRERCRGIIGLSDAAEARLLVVLARERRRSRENEHPRGSTSERR